ncbi:MAG: toll/interleukin-1 receptor domain-containing protein [Anaerolineae bacterium]|nr:toll/interleukin-1 receptor domain-containing protein [Anaerolineae bacterium]
MDDHLNDQFEDEEEIEFEEIEAYCMTCREKTPIENPQAIWTRKGAPGTRGICSVCGTTVFRMGRTDAHAKLKRPDPVQIAEANSKVQADATYINYSVTDAEFAEILSEDLNRIGIPTWLSGMEVEDVQWATGVHPSLVECKNMVVVLSPLAIKATNVQEALDFFVKNRKPIVVAQLQETELPDSLRRKARFDFSGDDYKRQFRDLVRALTE